MIIEFEDKLRYRKAAVVGSGNFISVDEFANISRYAKEHNIEISYLDGTAFTPTNGYHGTGEGVGEKTFPIGIHGSPVCRT